MSDDKTTDVIADGKDHRTQAEVAKESTPLLEREKALAARHSLRVWLYPLVTLAGVSLLVQMISWGLDRDANSPGLVDVITHFDSQRGVDALSNVAQIVTQVLGVAISVVAIIVELASNRYTHRITGLFFRAKVNFAVMGFFVIAGLNAVWVSMTYHENHVPVRATLFSMTLMTLSMLLLLPYFAFVFDFVNPMNVVLRIRREALGVVTEASSHSTLGRVNAEHLQHTASDGTDQLSDVAINAMANHDGAIAMAAVNALGDLARDYLSIKRTLPPDWFQISEGIARDPDFVSMSHELLDALRSDRTWFEFKVLRQLQTIYQGALGANRELCYVVAIRTRDLTESAMDAGDTRVVALGIKFFNTYLRSTVNARDVRTAYNVLNQYRLLAESALRRGRGVWAIEIARYFKYYGQLAFHGDLGFILETAAYDLSALNELAFDLNASERTELLKVFLQVDKEGEGASREASLRGVRKAQVRLATYYLVRGDHDAAREVFRDMRQENPARLASIRDEMLSVASSDFWEITDRGTNFDYLNDERKLRLVEFFAWFGDTLTPPRKSLIPGHARSPMFVSDSHILPPQPLSENENSTK
jgi:hypothetical protein